MAWYNHRFKHGLQLTTPTQFIRRLLVSDSLSSVSTDAFFADHLETEETPTFTRTGTPFNAGDIGETGTGAGMRDAGNLARTSIFTTTAAGGSITADLGSIKWVTRLSFMPASSGGDGWGPNYANSSLLEISSDGSTWTTIGTFTSDLPAFGIDAYQNILIGKNIRYIRLSKTVTYLALGEFRVYSGTADTAWTGPTTNLAHAWSLRGNLLDDVGTVHGVMIGSGVGSDANSTRVQQTKDRVIFNGGQNVIQLASNPLGSRISAGQAFSVFFDGMIGDVERSNSYQQSFLQFYEDTNNNVRVVSELDTGRLCVKVLKAGVQVQAATTDSFNPVRNGSEAVYGFSWDGSAITAIWVNGVSVSIFASGVAGYLGAASYLGGVGGAADGWAGDLIGGSTICSVIVYNDGATDGAAVYAAGPYTYVANLAVSLTASNLTVSSPVLGTPTITQTHVLTATALASASPVFGTPTLTQTQMLTATALTVASPAFATPTLTQTQILVATALAVSSPVLGTPTITQTQVLTASSLAVSSLALDTPTITQVQFLSAANLAVGPPDFGTASFSLVTTLIADALVVSSPVFDTPSVTQTHVVVASDLVDSSPVLGTPDLTQTHTLTADALVASGPQLGLPSLTQTQVLSALGLVVSSPVLDAAALTQTHLLSATSNAVAIPVLGVPALTQTHVLTGTALASASPVFGSPDLFSTSSGSAFPLVVSSPEFGTPTLTQRQVLAASSLSIASPALDTPALTQRHALTASPLVVSALAIDTAALTQVHLLVAADFAVSALSLPTPTLAILGFLNATDLVVSSPELGTPTLVYHIVQTGVHEFVGRVSALFVTGRIDVPIIDGRLSFSIWRGHDSPA